MTAAKPQLDREVAELLLQLGRKAYADTAVGGLTPAQWIALRYFGRANRFCRTISAFADFHGTTRGTASQTVKSLVSQGYLTRHRSERDGRSARFGLTPRARRALTADPLDLVVRAAGKLTPTQQRRTASALRQMTHALCEERERPAAGICKRCGHLAGRDGDYRCRLLEEPLDSGELDELCIRFLPAVPNRGRAAPASD